MITLLGPHPSVPWKRYKTFSKLAQALLTATSISTKIKNLERQRFELTFTGISLIGLKSKLLLENEP
jgi:hypothetical protein